MSMMRLVYLAHPVSGDVPGNLAAAERWMGAIMRRWPGVAPVAPWISYCRVLDDADPGERKLGMRADLETLRRCDELWMLGLTWSAGMVAEAEHAHRCGVIVRALPAPGDGLLEGVFPRDLENPPQWVENRWQTAIRGRWIR